ncbi:hypothetical protein AeMF1_021597 [Aphanomyces euteiches]|nr:hypothetical protein AeMF1_021597 [Aphanomyces euteiches]
MSPTIKTDDSKQEAIVFRGKNFNIFKLRIQAKLRSKGLWTIVSGDTTVSDAASTSDFDAKEAKAFAILVNALDDDNFAYVAHVTTSAAVWKLLIERYEARTYADVSNVIHELHTKTYEVGKSMQSHITDICVLQQKHMYMGTRVDDDMLGRILLTSVKEVFPTTVEILRNREPAPTLQQVVDRLLSKESEEERTAKDSKRKPWKLRVKDKCLYCHKPGHPVAECRYKKRDVAKGIQRKCLPNDDEEINVLEQAEGFILVTTDQDRLDIGNKWILDSGCTTDVTGDKTLFSKLTRSGQVSLRMANDTSVKSTQSGSVKIRVDNDQILDRPWVMYVPGLTKNLLSLRRLLQDGFAIPKWTADSAVLIKNTLALSAMAPSTGPSQLWGNQQAAEGGVVDGLSLSKSDLVGSYSCDAREIAKAKRMSYKNTHPYRAQVPLERVHIDKSGPITPPTFGGMVYYELYVDEASRFKWLFLLKSKSETLDNFKKFHVYAERQFGRKIKTIMTDNAQEYLAKALTAYCSSVGIEQLYTNVYSPEENCIAEQPTTSS